MAVWVVPSKSPPKSWLLATGVTTGSGVEGSGDGEDVGVGELKTKLRVEGKVVCVWGRNLSVAKVEGQP